MHGRRSDADADTADGNWKLDADWKCTDMHSRLSDWLAIYISRKFPVLTNIKKNWIAADDDYASFADDGWPLKKQSE